MRIPRILLVVASQVDTPLGEAHVHRYAAWQLAGPETTDPPVGTQARGQSDKSTDLTMAAPHYDPTFRVIDVEEHSGVPEFSHLEWPSEMMDSMTWSAQFYDAVNDFPGS